MVDTVGAGDAFTAALTVGLLRGDPLGRVHSPGQPAGRVRLLPERRDPGDPGRTARTGGLVA